MMPLHPAYFETRFVVTDHTTALPQEFAIITAYATTGTTWTDSENQLADRELENVLRNTAIPVARITGFSPTTGHAEPAWITLMSWADACDLGRRFHQDAIYFVSGDTLYVSLCDERRSLVEVGPFRERVTTTTCLP